MAARTRHFMLLDGMRGIAALAVVAYHFGKRTDLPNFFPHDYPVDFFFVLSGFVLAGAYGSRLRASLTASAFIIRRLVRLLPVLVPGSIVGAVIEMGRPNVGGTFAHLVAAVGAAVLGCLIIPWPFSTSMEQTLFPINGPLWSLFFELVASIVYIAVARAAFPAAVSARIVAVSGIALIGCVCAYGTTKIGAEITSWPGAVPRTFYSFFTGVILFGLRDRFPVVAAWKPTLVLVGILCVPLLPDILDMCWDMTVMLLVSPVLVGVASNSPVPPRFIPACRLLGDISYPVYAIHYPIVRAISFVTSRSGLSAGERLGVAAISVACIACVSWVVFVAYDRPLRQYLTRRLGLEARTAGIAGLHDDMADASTA